MKKNNLAKGLVALSVLGLVSASALAVNAASTNTGKSLGSSPLTANSGCAMGKGMHKNQNLTDAQKKDLEAKQAAVFAAMESGNYDNWVAAVKAKNANAPVLSVINASNFARYAEAHKLRAQANSITAELGLDKGQGSYGGGHPGGGFGRMMKGASN